MTVTEDAVRQQLKNVVDPELFVNVVDLGLVYSIALRPREDGAADVTIEMTMTSPMCPAAPQMIRSAEQEVGAMEGVGEVEVKIVMDPPWSPDRMTDEARDQLGMF